MSRVRLALLSALDASALKARAEDVAEHLARDPSALDDTLYTLAVGRKRFAQRASVVIPADADPARVIREMERANTERTQNGPSTQPHVVMMFPGQGSQFIGMGRELFYESATFRERFQFCDRILAPRLGLSLEELLFRGEVTEEASSTLRQTSIAQPALFAVEYCLAQVLIESGVRPDLLIGHSIGEFAAASLAGVFTLEAALELVAERGRLMQSQPPGAMAAVRTTPDRLLELLPSEVTLAAHNAPDLCVVAGDFAPMAKFREVATAAGLEVRELHTSHAFHSPMMDPILEPFRAAVLHARPEAPKIPIISTLTGKELTAEEATSADYWARQLRFAVRFTDGVRTLYERQNLVLIEVGPGTALASSAAKQLEGNRPRAIIETLGGPKDPRNAVEATLRALGRLWLQGAELDAKVLFDADQRRLVRLPTYRFSRQRHWVTPPTVSASERSAGPLIAEVSADVGGAAGPGALAKRVHALLGSRLGRPLDGSDLERSLVELGFDSLALSQLRARLQEQFGVDVPVRLLFEGCDTPTLLAEHIEAKLPAATSAVSSEAPATANASPRPAEAGASGPGIATSAPLSTKTPRADVERRATTTEPQRELWVSCATGGDDASLCYNECRRLDLRGPLDVELLDAALQELVRRHEALRLVFNAGGSEFTVRPYSTFPLRKTDLRQAAAEEREAALAEACRYEVETAFDLEHGPLFRAHLVHLADEHALLLLCGHHIVTDGSSIFLLLREVAELYSAYKEQRSPDLPPADSYVAYAEAEVARAAGPEGGADEAFWLQHLAGHSDDLDLPTDRSRPPVRSFNAARQDFYLDAPTTEALRALGLRAKTTLQTTLMATVQLLLHRVTRQTDIVVGMPASGQAAVGARALLGHCVHTLPIRSYLDPARPFFDYLGDLRGVMLDCLEHQQVTFSSYLEKLGRPRDASRIPLVPFGFGMGRTPRSLAFSGLSVSVGTVPRVRESFEVYLFATEDGEGVNLAWSYNTDLFSAEAIQLWQRCLATLIRELVASAGASPMNGVPVLADEDRLRTLALALGPELPASDYLGAQARFGRHAERAPHEAAVIALDKTLSYEELNRQANRLGNWLARRKMPPGGLVAVCLERTSELVWALLGVWRAGLAYVPLDPKYPKARVHMILEDSGAPVVLTSRDLADDLVPPGAAVEVVLVEDILEELEQAGDGVPEVERSPDDLAYVIFTSGSTGRPKGVQITQRAFDNFIVSMAKEPGFSARDRILALTTVSFDIAGLELFLPLTQGGSLVLVSADQAMDPAALSELARTHRVNVLQATPATYQLLLDGGWQGDPGLKVLCGGEAFPQQLAERLLACTGEVWNVYGPTETTVWSSVKRVTQATDLTIGRPIDNTTMYVLDDSMQLSPLGSAGELWIGGRGVARGYLGRPDLTAERFKPNPYLEGDVIYRTGDLARLRRDGELECLGRVDFQVKIRGFRIELGEIETAILQLAEVANAVVVAREDQPGDKLLAAYLVAKPGGTVDLAELRQHVASLLPAYMVPSAYMVLDELPMTPNNKVDRKALPPPAATGDVDYEAPDLPRAAASADLLWSREWVAAPALDEELPPCAWLVACDDDEGGRVIVRELTRKGHTVTRVYARDRFHEAGEDEFTVNPEFGEQHFEQLMKRLAELGRLPDRVLHLWLAGTKDRVRLGSSPYHHHQERGLFSLLHLSANYERLAPERALTFHVVVPAPVAEAGADDARGRAAVLGISRAIPRELPRQQVAVLELDDKQALASRKTARLIVDEVSRGPKEELVSWRDGKRRRSAWRAVRAERRTPVKDDGAALVVGFSDLGQAWARRLAERSKSRVLFVAAPGEAASAELAAEIRALGEHSVSVHGLDGALDHAAFVAKLAQLASEVGPIRTVVLAIPELSPLSVLEANEGEIEARLAPVLQVLLGLERLPLRTVEHLLVNVPLVGSLGTPGALADAITAALFEFGASVPGPKLTLCKWGERQREGASGSATTSHVALDRAHFATHGLRSEEVAASIDAVLSRPGGQLAVSPFELERLSERLDASAARDAGARSGAGFVFPKDDTERRLAEIWASVLRRDRVSTQDSFFDLGGHSLLAVRLFATIEKEFGVSLPLAVLFKSPTITALADHLRADADAPESGREAATESDLLVRLNVGSDPQKQPLFVVGGAFGNVLNLRHVARLVDPKRDFYGIQAQGLDGRLPPHQTLVEAAAEYVKHVRRVQPEGPYLLGGFCVGGVVAVEMARLLKSEGEEIAPVILLDSHVPEVRGTLSVKDRMQIQTELLREGRTDYVRKWTRDKYNYIEQRLKKKLGAEEEPDPTQYRSQLVRDAIAHGMKVYQPQYYDGDVVLMRPPLAPKHHLAGGRMINVRRFFLLEDNGWGRLVRSLEVQELAVPPGDHDGFVLEPHVRELARRLGQLIESITRAPAPLRAHG